VKKNFTKIWLNKQTWLIKVDFDYPSLFVKSEFRNSQEILNDLSKNRQMCVHITAWSWQVQVIMLMWNENLKNDNQITQ